MRRKAKQTQPVLISSEQVTLYCDIDGVLNIAGKEFADTITKRIFRKVPSVGRFLFPVPVKLSFRKGITDAMSLLPVKWVWLTTWNKYAGKLEKHSGVKSHETILYHMHIWETGRQKRKYALLQAHQKANPTPFIWIDDVATKYYKEKDWVGQPDHLIIRPDHKFGITEEHIASMREFVEKHSIVSAEK